jgi:hypothetical protein
MNNRAMTTTRRRAWWIALPVTLGLLAASCSPRSGSDEAPVDSEAAGPVWFEDVTDAVGLDFVHDPGPTGEYLMPQINGAGCAFIREPEALSIYLLNSAGPGSKSVNRLYRRTPRGKFADVTAGSGLDVAGAAQGVAIGDVNNDGLPDVLLTQVGLIRLFLNRGNGKFEDATAEAGLSNLLWATSAAFVDYDRDGRLDLIVVNYLDYDPRLKCPTVRGAPEYCAPSNFPGTCSKLFRNLGPPSTPAGSTSVRFADVSFDTGIGRKPGPGLGVVCADFTGDSWPDIFISNDGKPNHLWISYRNPDGTVYFKEEAVARGVAFPEMGRPFAGMGIALGDVDNNGLLDLFVTHLGQETHTLWTQGPRGTFHDGTGTAGLTNLRWRGTGFGTLMADFDLDGSLDLAIVNGAVFAGGQARNTDLGFWETYAEKNQLLSNDGSGRFRDLSSSNKALCGRWNVGRGLACADFDEDGAPDLLVTAIGSRARLFRNLAPDRGHWLTIRAYDPKRQRDAYGAEVHIQVGSRQMLRSINPAESYLSSSCPYARFGLGKVERVDRILVKWPDGPPDEAEEEFDASSVDRLLVLTRGTGRKLKKGSKPVP